MGWQEWATFHHWLPPAFNPPRPRHILIFNGSCTPGWDNATGFSTLASGAGTLTAEEYYGPLGEEVPGMAFERAAEAGGGG